MIDYVEWTNSSSCRFSRHLGGRANVDGVDGQKAVCLDPFIRPEKECLVYSFGISNDDQTFDEAMEAFGCHVYTFDPTINANRYSHNSKIHFFNLGLGDRDERWNKNPNMNGTIKSLDFIYHNLLQHEGRIIDYLKIDIEHSEWIVLPQILASGMMDRVRQLGLEVHLPKQGGLQAFRKRINILKALEDYGLVRFSSKYHPWSLDWNSAVHLELYNAYEIVWFNSKLVRTNTAHSIRSFLVDKKKAHYYKKVYKQKYTESS